MAPAAAISGGDEPGGVARDLVNAVAGEVRLGLHDRMLYATDASLYQVEPLAVVIPASVEDAAAAVRFCVDRMLPILPRGGGTSLAGQCTGRAVVLDLSVNCRGVLEVDAPGRRCRVEPGVTIDELNAALAPTGLFFAPDPATSRHCNIGGAIGNNAAGGRSIRYGRTSESLLGVDVVVGTGQRVRLERGAWERDPVARELTERVVEVVRRHERLIRERFPRTVRRNAGYGLDMVLAALDAGGGDLANVNLAHLLAGSEGTLAVTLGAELLLHPLPAAKGLATVAFASVDEAIEAVGEILETGPSAVELLDDVVLGLAGANAEYRRYVELMPRAGGAVPAAVLYVEYFADGEVGVAARVGAAQAEIVERLAGLVGRFGASRVRTFTDATAMLEAWKLRKAGEPLLHGMPGQRKPITFIEDNAIPVERLGEFVRRLREIVARHGTRAAYWAHASVGVLHVRPMLDIHDERDRARLRSIAVETARLARDLGGVMSGEHGDGRARGPLLEEFFGCELMGAFAEVKRVFDPRGLLNPGNIVPVGSLGMGRLSEPDALPALPGLDGRESTDRTGDAAAGEADSAASSRHGEGVDVRLGEPAHPEPAHLKPAHLITEQLRVKPGERDVRVPSVDTFFDYADQHGFDGAVEMCNGAGVCRKKQGGTMCPSYMGTLDERHSTRGRGNALRLAITGQLNEAGIAAPLGGREAPRTTALPMAQGSDGAREPAPYPDAAARKTAGRTGWEKLSLVRDETAVAQESASRLIAPLPGARPVARRSDGARGQEAGMGTARPSGHGGPRGLLRSVDGPMWNDAETHKTLDLCLSCKACKTECPSNVDIARLKAEYTAQGFRAAGRVPWRVRVMSSIRTLNAAGSRVPRLASRVQGIEPVGRAVRRALGIHEKRSLPGFGRWLGNEFGARDRGVPARGGDGDARPMVALFGDCFAMGNEPEIGLAARRVLEACGYRVLLPRHGCCARPAISLGWLERAVGEIDQACLDLRPVIEDARVRAVLFMEPSCLSAVKDDWLALKVRTPVDVRRRLAAKSWLVEDFVDRMWDEHPRRPVLARAAGGQESGEIVLHGHCHQKALWGAETSARLLRRVPGARVTVLDSGCCGMAGSFGYAAHRYDLSMKIGELVLLPAVRQAEGAAIAAPGTSCRHQIRDGAGRRAKHPIEIVAERLNETRINEPRA